MVVPDGTLNTLAFEEGCATAKRTANENLLTDQALFTACQCVSFRCDDIYIIYTNRSRGGELAMQKFA